MTLDLIQIIDERVEAKLRAMGKATVLTPKEMRAAKNIDRETLAKLSEVSMATIGRYETGGVSEPEPANVARIAKALGVSAGEYGLAVVRMSGARK